MVAVNKMIVLKSYEEGNLSLESDNDVRITITIMLYVTKAKPFSANTNYPNILIACTVICLFPALHRELHQPAFRQLISVASEA